MTAGKKVAAVDATAAQSTIEERVSVVAAALAGGCRFFQDIRRETGLSQGHIDRALQKLRKDKRAVYSGKDGWSLSVSGTKR